MHTHVCMYVCMYAWQFMYMCAYTYKLKVCMGIQVTIYMYAFNACGFHCNIGC